MPQTMVPLQEVMDCAKRGSLPHLKQLWEGLSETNYSIDALEILLSHLQVPKLVGDAEVPDRKVALEVLEHGLTKAVEAYPPSLTLDIGRRLASTSEGIVGWMHFLMGEDDDSAYKAWKYKGMYGQTGPRAQGLHMCTNALLFLLKFEDVKAAFGRSRNLHRLVLTWWMATCDGEILLYPWAGRRGGPQEDTYDFLILIFTCLADGFAEELAESLMMIHPRYGARVAEIFAQRTVQRLNALTQINTLEHLAKWPDATNEFDNIKGIAFIIFKLIRAKNNSTLQVVFLQENMTASFLKAFSLLSARFSALPPSEETSLKNFEDLVLALAQCVRWSADAPFPYAMSTMKCLIGNGLLDIVVGYVKLRSHWPRMEFTEADKAVKVVLTYCYGASLCPRLTTTYSRAINVFTRNVGRHLGPVILERAFQDFVVGFSEYPSHLPKASRARVCDNFYHRKCVSMGASLNNVGTQKVCSGCHSVVYCSQRCQMEDWKGRHREECRPMSLEYLSRKESSSWYSYNLRTFHLSIIRHAYARTPGLWNVFAGPHNRLVDSRIVATAIVFWPEVPYQFNEIDVYVDGTRPLIPECKRSRFDDLVARFKAATPHPDGTRNGVSFLSHGLINGVFRVGDEELNYVVLLHRRAHSALPGASSDFEVEGYLVYTCQGWERTSTCLSPMQTYTQAMAMGPGLQLTELGPYDM